MPLYISRGECALSFGSKIYPLLPREESLYIFYYSGQAPDLITAELKKSLTEETLLSDQWFMQRM